MLSAFLALNIGANNSAASMATSYGAGVRSKRQAVWLIAIFALLGALTAGAPVVETVGKGIVPAETLSSDIGFIFIILLLGIGFIVWANIVRTPIATTHAIVCAIVGIGLYTQTLNSDSFIRVLKWWILAPIVAWLINFAVAKFFYFKIVHYLASNFSEKRVNVILTVLITISGTFIAFSGGANNSANAIGPIVSLGLIDSYPGAILAGVAMGVGAILLGGRVLETLGKKITEICIIRAISVEFTAAVIILLASLYGNSGFDRRDSNSRSCGFFVRAARICPDFQKQPCCKNRFFLVCCSCDNRRGKLLHIPRIHKVRLVVVSEFSGLDEVL